MIQNRRLGQAGLWAATLTAAILAASCSKAPAEAPAQTRPMQEGRARQLIAEAIATAGRQPTGERLVDVPRDKQLSVDVGVSGFKHGVAFVTGPERQRLGNSIPAYDVGSDALRLVRDVKDPGTRILLLHDLAYMTDEQQGEKRNVSSVTVERQLQRDVQDFLAEAKRQQWP